jgi:hypothetical protein
LAGVAFFNQARSPLAVAVAFNDATIQLVSGGPWAGATGPFTVMIDSEAIRCSGINGNILTVAAGGRGFDGTSPQAHALTDSLGNPTMVVGAIVRRDLTDAFARLDTAAEQSLTGPLAIPPAIGSAVAPHAAGGGTLDNKLDEQSTASGASVTLTVPAGALFRSLVIEITGRSDQASAQLLVAQFNGDVAGNYDYSTLSDVNTTLTGVAPQLAQTSGKVASLSPSGAAAGAVADYEIVIQNADSTSLRKLWTANGGRWDADNAAGSVIELVHGQWRNVTAAITSILLKAPAGNLVNFRAILRGRP